MGNLNTYYVAFRCVPAPSPKYSGEAGDAPPELHEALNSIGAAWDSSRPALFDWLEEWGADEWPDGYPEWEICLEDIDWDGFGRDVETITRAIPNVVMRVRCEGMFFEDSFLVYGYQGKIIGAAPEITWPEFDLNYRFEINLKRRF